VLATGFTATTTATRDGAMITESQIKAAIRRVTAKEKELVEIHDDGPRGAGRLFFRVRSGSGERAIAEFYAAYYRSGRRTMARIGAFDAEGRQGGLTLAAARKRFREEFQPAISAGREPDRVAARRASRESGGTVKELFQAYVDHLKASGKRSARPAECVLLTGKHNAADALGADRQAGSIEPEEIVVYLASIHRRGRIVMAHATRQYISAAYNFAIRGARDYTANVAGKDWRIKANPVASIPMDKRAVRPGTRFLLPAEFRTLWLWLEARDERSGLAPALRLIMASGQRVEEILRLDTSSFDRDSATLSWTKTKNGLPHSIPLPRQALDILTKLPTNKHGLFFPHQRDPSKPKVPQGMKELIARFLEDHPEVPKFTAKDMRRTFKTFGASAGISKDDLDRLQNHSRRDVSSVHYNKWSYLPEKRAAMDRWADFVDAVLDGTIVDLGQRSGVVVPFGAASAG
jgi:integrase